MSQLAATLIGGVIAVAVWLGLLAALRRIVAIVDSGRPHRNG